MQFKKKVQGKEGGWWGTRVVTRGLEGGRMDLEFEVRDEVGEVVWVARQGMVVGGREMGRRFGKL